MINSFRKYIAITLFLGSAISLTTSGMWVYTLYQKVFRENDNVIESYQTIRAINRTLLSVNQAALDVSSFIITGDTKFIIKLPEFIISIRVNLSTLSRLIQDDSTEIELNKTLNIMVNKKIEFLQSTMKLRPLDDKNIFSSLASNPNRLELTNNINQLMDQIKSIEINQLEKAAPNYQFNRNYANKAFILLGIVNVLLILISFSFTRPFLNLDANV